MKIQIEKLSFSYDEAAPLLKSIDFTLNAGRVISILGPNGAGKTTLLNCIAGLFKPREGNILIDGKNMETLSHREVARIIGYVPQIIVPAFSYSVLDYVVTGCAPHIGTFERPKQIHFDAAMAALESMGIAALRDKPYNEISGGERQQVSIARALAQRPAFILMDEPTAHLDYGNQIQVLKTIRTMASQGYGIALTTHNPNHALLLGDQLAVLERDGTFTFGKCKEVLTEPFLNHLYGIDLRLEEIPSVGRRVCFAPKL